MKSAFGGFCIAHLKTSRLFAFFFVKHTSDAAAPRRFFIFRVRTTG